MRRMLVGACGVLVVLALVAGALLWWGGPDDPEPRAAATPTPAPSASVRPAPVLESTLPDPAFRRTMSAAGVPATYDGLLDRCAGPVAIDMGDDVPLLVAEHDYCGGSAWIPRLDTDDVVELDGPGVEDGEYRVTEIGHATRKQATVDDLPPGEVVLQTCISQTQMVLVALQRV